MICEFYICQGNKLPGYAGSSTVLQELVDWVEAGELSSSRKAILTLKARRDHLVSLFPEATNASVRAKLLEEIEKFQGELSGLETGGVSFATQYHAILRHLCGLAKRAGDARKTAVPAARRAARRRRR